MYFSRILFNSGQKIFKDVDTLVLFCFQVDGDM